MNRIARSSIAFAVLALALGTAHSAQAQTAYALAANGGAIISFNVATPGNVTLIGKITGAVSNLSDIDFRVANGLLYGYDQGTNQIVTVNTTTGATTFVSNSSIATNSDFVGLDFNPAADRLRIVGDSNQNLRINVATGVATGDQTLSYAAGDAHAGTPPSIHDVAYTNNDNNPGTGTTLYYLDSASHTLVSTATPNGPGGGIGFLNTVGPLDATQDNNFGFDIFTDANGVNSAYGIFDSPTSIFGGASLYNINLGTGAASFIGFINGNSPFFGLAIAPVASAVPEPGSVALLVGMTTASIGIVRKRRARK